MEEFLANLPKQLITDANWFVLSFFLFALLSRFTPNIKGQKLINRDFITDAVYWFIPTIFYSIIYMYMAVAFHLYLAGGDEKLAESRILNGYPPLSDLPILVQSLLILLLLDFVQYWLHRFFHGKELWKFHAIHHMPEEVDWHTAARFHPVNYIVSFTITGALCMALGFAPAAFALLVPFNRIYAGLVHANLNWTFGPFKYVLASPVFHRWHHTSEAEGMDKNFAPTFPFLDLMFGTFYMPEGKLPTKFGIAGGDKIANSFIGQTLYPFK